MQDNQFHFPHLTARKYLVFRQAIDKAIECVSIEVSRDENSSKEPGYLNELRVSLLQIPNNDKSMGDDSVTLDQCLSTLASVVEQQIERSPLGDSSRKNLKQQISAQLGAINCTKCANSSENKPCNGSESDSETVNNGGWCLNSFYEMFKSIYGYVEQHVLTSVLNSNQETVIKNSVTRMYIESHTNKPHALKDCDYYVSGKTIYRDNLTCHDTAIFLAVATGKFSWRCVLASAHVLMHEVAVHAFQALDTELGIPRDLPAADEPFSEGWMEYAAYLLTLDWQAPQDWDGFKEAAGVMHRAKCDPQTNPFLQPDGPIARCALGRTTAEKFIPLVAEFSISPEKDFLKLSAQLNMCSATPEERSKFTFCMSRLLAQRYFEKSDLKDKTITFYEGNITPYDYMKEIIELAGLNDIPV